MMTEIARRRDLVYPKIATKGGIPIIKDGVPVVYAFALLDTSVYRKYNIGRLNGNACKYCR